FYFVFRLLRCPPTSVLFPYTTLFRSYLLAHSHANCSGYWRSRDHPFCYGINCRSFWQIPRPIPGSIWEYFFCRCFSWSYIWWLFCNLLVLAVDLFYQLPTWSSRTYFIISVYP